MSQLVHQLVHLLFSVVRLLIVHFIKQSCFKLNLPYVDSSLECSQLSYKLFGSYKIQKKKKKGSINRFAFIQLAVCIPMWLPYSSPCPDWGANVRICGSAPKFTLVPPLCFPPVLVAYELAFLSLSLL